MCEHSHAFACVECVMQGGARNLGRDDIGELAPGFAADFVSWKFRGVLGFVGSGVCVCVCSARLRGQSFHWS